LPSQEILRNVKYKTLRRTILRFKIYAIVIKLDESNKLILKMLSRKYNKEINTSHISYLHFISF